MNRLLILPLLAVGALIGCGDPAPSTALAPDVKMPDTSKMSPEEITKLHNEQNAGTDRTTPAKSAPAAPVGHGDTPSDRGG